MDKNSTIPNCTYADIIRSLKARDQKSVNMLYNRYGEKLFSYCVDRWHLPEKEGEQIVRKTLEVLIGTTPRYIFHSQNKFEGYILKVFIKELAEKYRQSRCDQNIKLISFDGLDISMITDAQNTTLLNEYYGSHGNQSEILKDIRNILAVQFTEAEKDFLMLQAQNFTCEEIPPILKSRFPEYGNYSFKNKCRELKLKVLQCILGNLK